MTAYSVRPPGRPSTPVEALLDRLARFESGARPVLSLYLDARADQHGSDGYDAFRRELTARVRAFPLRSPARASLERDGERALAWLRDAVRPSANGVAIFACADAALWETLQLEVPFPEHRCIVRERPHVYDLARLLDQRPRGVACLADTHAARFLVFGHGLPPDTRELHAAKPGRTDIGGWPQPRHQHQVDAHHQHHAREIVAMLERVVREDCVEHIVLAGDDVIVPLVRAELPKALAGLVVDVLRLDMRTAQRDALEATWRALRAHDARADAERVAALLDQCRAGGRGVAGVAETQRALAFGQVDTLVLSARPDAVGTGTDGTTLADELVARARRTGARVTFVEDPALLAPVEGVGGLLRYRVHEVPGEMGSAR